MSVNPEAAVAALENIAAAAGRVVVTGVEDVKAAVGALAPHMREMLDLAAKAEQSPLVQAALSTALGPELEKQLADYIVLLDKTLAADTAPVPAPVQPAA